MANCIRCKKSVTSGYVLCSDCADEDMALAYYVDRLAEDIVSSEDICSCHMCVIGNCGSQVSGMTCRNGVKTWLLGKRKEYSQDMALREEKIFAYLDRLRQSGADMARAKELLEERFPYLKNSADGSDALLCAWQTKRRCA